MDNQLDFLLKSLAKEALSGISRDEAKNETKEGEKGRERGISVEDCPDAEAELLTKSLPAEIPNNITKLSSAAKPIPPNQLKCNILKAKVEEEMHNNTKMTNQMFVVAAKEDEANLNSLNAATFVSVVRF